MRAKSAIAGKNPDPKCMLQSAFFGEKQWDGKNMGITLEQLQYLADRSLFAKQLDGNVDDQAI